MLDRVRTYDRSSGRRALRRAVTLDCEVFSDRWDGSVSLPATDLSHLGLWLQTPLPLERGEEIIVSLTPPRWPFSSPLVALAMVVRVGLNRRRCDVDGSGMGLAFADLESKEVSTLIEALRDLPPPLPTRQPAALPSPALETISPPLSAQPEPAALERIVRLDDGSFYALTAEGALLTGGRSAAAPSRPRLVWSRPEVSRSRIQTVPRTRPRQAA